MSYSVHRVSAVMENYWVPETGLAWIEMCYKYGDLELWNNYVAWVLGAFSYKDDAVYGW